LEESTISLPQCMQNMISTPEDGRSNGVAHSELPISTMSF
jgi:hypothetical protein